MALWETFRDRNHKFAPGGEADINQLLLDLNSRVRILIRGIVYLRSATPLTRVSRCLLP